MSNYTAYNKKYFADNHFSYNYSLCPLEDVKDVLFYKFGRPTIGQNCSAVCTNKGGHRDAFLNERHKAPRILRGLLSRPHATEPQAKRETRSVLCHSLVVDLMFKQNENVAIAVVSSSSCC